MARNQCIVAKVPRTLTGALAGIVHVPAPVSGNIVRAYVKVPVAPSGGTAIFDVNVAGTSIWAGDPTQRLIITDGNTTDENTAGLPVAVTKYDQITIDFDGFTGTADSIGTYVLLIVEIEETGATSTDATLLARASHTGTQLSTTISDFAEAVDDRIEALVIPGVALTRTYNDGSNTYTLDVDITELAQDVAPDGAADYVMTWDASASAHKKVLLDDLPGGGGSYTDEEAQDAVGGIFADTATIELVYTDGTPEITANVRAASITEAMQVLADNTTNDVSTTKHGYAPKGDGDTTKFLNANGAYSVPSGSSGGVSLSGARGAQVNKTGTQSISDNSNTLVTWDQELSDSDGYHESVTFPGRLTVPAGMPTQWYLIIGTVRWAYNAVGCRSCHIHKNGSSSANRLASVVFAANTSVNSIANKHQAVAIAQLAVGDYVELYAYQDSGGSLNIEITNNESYFAIIPIAPNVSGQTDVGVKVTKSADQSIGDSSTTLVTFNQEDRDDGGFHDNAIDNERLTVPIGRAGWYVITAEALFASNSVGDRTVEIRKNGSTNVAATRADACNAISTSVVATALVYCAVGDYFEVRVFQSSTGALDLRGSATAEGSWFAMVPASTIGSSAGGVSSVTAKTASYNILTGDSGSVFTNEGASAIVPFTLPAAASGLEYTLFVQDADGIQVIAGAGDTIRIGSLVTAAAGNVQSNTIGSSVTLKAINATEWVAIAALGTWA
jgi:hypothetical protein